MNKSVLLKGCVFQLKSNLNCLVEVVTVKNCQAKVIKYNKSGSERVFIDISDLKEMPLSIPVLNSLGFEDRKERLMGLPYEHYWQKQVNKHIVWIVEDNGILKYATIDANAYHGVRFSPAPYLHELQNIIGPIDVAKLYKDLLTVR